MVINKEIMDINLLLLDIKKSYKAYLKKQGINLKIKLIDDDIYLYADYNKLKQVLIKNKNVFVPQIEQVEYENEKTIIENIDENKRIITLTPYGRKYEEICEAVL